MTWLVNGKTIARKIKNRNHGTTTSTNNAVADGKEGDFGCETIIECPYCGNVLEEGNALIQKAAKELARHDYGIRSGFFPDDESTILEDQKHSIVRASAPDILLYIEEVICSCAALGFSGTSGSTLSENILLLREANTCNG